MYHCPACHSDAIPKYRALLNIPSTEHDCPHCHAKLRKRTSSLGNVCIVVFFTLSVPFASFIQGPPMVIIIGGFVLPFVTGISLLLHTVKIQVCERESAFTPHSRELKF